MNVDNLNKTYPKYPITVLDKGWVYGVWYCGTSFQKSLMYGQHPPTYLKRLKSLFPEHKIWLHAPSGIIKHGIFGNQEHHTLDLISRGDGVPEIIGSVANIPFDNNYFDVVETDPPYSDKDSNIYGTPKYPRRKAMSEFYRVLKPGGYLVWLDVRYPAYRRGVWKLEGLIGVITGFERVSRICSIFKKLPEEQ